MSSENGNGDENEERGGGEKGVPFVGQTFASWAEAKSYLDNYAHSNFFQFTTSSSCSVSNENKKLEGRGETNLYKQELIHKNIMITCVSGGPVRINKGKGERPLQATWKTVCPSSVHLIADKNVLRVKSFVVSHNHECHENYFKSLPKTRRETLSQDKATSTALLFFKAGVKPCVIRSVLRDIGCGSVTARDLSNLRAKWKKEGRSGRTSEEKLIETLQKILELDPGSYIYCGMSEDQELQYLFIQTTPMRKNMEKFGQIVLLDHTYKINRNRMPVSVLMTMDGHGNGRSVGYAFIANEKAITIENVLSGFKDAIGNTLSANIKTMVIDKDYSEVKAIKNVFPDVAIQLCDFHVTRTFKKRGKNEDIKVKKIIEEMRYCTEDNTFDSMAKELEQVASKEFFKYFQDNWLNCPIAWSFRDKRKSANLGNNTTNRLESHNGKVKMMLDYNNELYEAIENLLDLVSNKEEDVIYRNETEVAKKSYIMHCNDPLVDSILNGLTKFSAKLVLFELYQTEVSDDELGRFQPSSSECKCPHFASFLLPCRHIFTVRRRSGLTVFENDEVDSMWHQGYESSVNESSGNPQAQRIFGKVVPSRLVPYTWNDKYTHSMVKLKEIAGLMAESGEIQYSQRYAQLETLLKLWATGKETVVCEVLSTGGVNVVSGTEVQEVQSSGAQESAVSRIVEPVSAVRRDLPILPEGQVQQAQTSAETVVCEVLSTGNAVNAVSGIEMQTIEDQEVQSSGAQKSAVSRTIEPASALRHDLSILPEVQVQQVQTSESVAPMTAAVSVTFMSSTSSYITSKGEQPTSCHITPLCWCGSMTKRVVAGPSSRMAGRAFYVCPDSLCKFRQFAPKNNETIRNNLESSNQDSDVDNDRNIMELAEVIDSPELTLDDEEENQMLADVLDTTIQTAPLLESDNHLDQSSKEQPLPHVPCDVANVLAGLKLPVAICHKGRPQGLGKTNPKPSRKKGSSVLSQVFARQPSGAILPSSLGLDDVEYRRVKGAEIPDSDVKWDEEENVYYVTSQGKGKKNTPPYKVQKGLHDCLICDSNLCDHTLTCNCPDYTFRKKSCKHIFKVISISQKKDDRVVKSCRISLDGITVDNKINDVNTQEKEDGNKDATGCFACKLTGPPEGAHRCQKCGKPVHPFPECSVVVANASEGYGARDRICLQCHSSGQNNGIFTIPSAAAAANVTIRGTNLKQGPIGLQQIGLNSRKVSLFESPPVYTNGDLSCNVCKMVVTVKSKCIKCQKSVHAEDCSIASAGGTNTSDRLCLNCYCLLCKAVKDSTHQCMCHICHSVGGDVLCYRCEKICHKHLCSSRIVAVELSVHDKTRFICSACEHAARTGISFAAFQELSSMAMMCDEHLTRASVMLREQYGHDIGGLSAPLGVAYGGRVEHVNYYEPRDMNKDYVQIMHSGTAHWVTAIFQKGSTMVTIFDSQRQSTLSGHIKMQVAMIAQSSSNIAVVRPPCKQQTNDVDCGLYAIANAVEFCATKKISYIDFVEGGLRSHWEKCLEEGKIECFPRNSKRPKKVKDEENIDFVHITCKCHLPDEYGNMIECDKCGSWFHNICVQLPDNFVTKKSWSCSACSV